MYQKNEKIRTAVTYGSAMEFGDHFKNGASLKSRMSRSNLIKTVILCITIFCINFPVQSQSTNLNSYERKQFFKVLLNKFCAEYYNDCFDGRRYVSNSLTVTNVREDEDDSDIIRIDGNHEYLNYIDIADKQPYYAKISINTNRNRIKITFHKKSKNWLGKDYWESCTKSVDMDEL
jgi:hypothetical protein